MELLFFLCVVTKAFITIILFSTERCPLFRIFFSSICCELLSDLHIQVTLVHVNAVAKNAADDKLRQSLRRFAHTYPAPSTVVLVSSDVNFSSELNDLRHVHNMTIVLVHSKFTSDALKVFAQTLVNYEHFLEDVEGPKGTQVGNDVLSPLT